MSAIRRMLTTLFAPKSIPHRNLRPVRLGVESMENRLVPTITALYDATGGTLHVTGTEAADRIYVGTVSGSVRVWNGENTSGTPVLISSNGSLISSVPLSALNAPSVGYAVRLNGLEGDDQLALATDFPSRGRLIGGVGNDTLIGGNDKDRLEPGSGNDLVLGNGGNDRIFGGEGRDTLRGGSGNDDLYGTDEVALYEGDNDADVLYGDSGNDNMYGGGGDDFLAGGDDNDTLRAGAGSDTLEGGSGEDLLYGGASQDTLYGDFDSDPIAGGVGHDQLFGESGFDTIYGGGGDDNIDGGTERDYLYGGNGSDTLIGQQGSDWLYGGASSDVLYGDLTDLNNRDFNGADHLFGEAGADSLYGGAGDDRLDGGTENDNLVGGFDNDGIDGRAGNDTLLGEHGNDILQGGTGADTLYGGTENDRLDGDFGEDVLYGGNGNDTMRVMIDVGMILNGGLGRRNTVPLSQYSSTSSGIDTMTVSLNLGSFLATTVWPVVSRVQSLTERFQPLVELFERPVPVVSLVDPTYTFGKLVEDVGYGNVTEFIEAIGKINALSEASFSGTVDLVTQQLSVSGSTQVAGAAFPNLPVWGMIQELNNAGLRFPLLQDPGAAVSLATGGNADFFTYDLPQLSAGFTRQDANWVYTYQTPYGPVSVVVYAEAGITADARFGCDTSGFGTGNIMSGFYAQNVTATVSLTFGVEGGYGDEKNGIFVGVGVSATGNIIFTLVDPNNDGKIRGAELDAILSQPASASVTTTGTLDARVYFFAQWAVFGKVVWRHEETLWNETFQLWN